MTAVPDRTPLSTVSAATTALVAAAAPMLATVHSHRSQSSGFVWKPGLIITADEALADEGTVAVTLHGGKTVDATVIGRDPSTDVALLRTEPADLAPARFVTELPKAGALTVAVGAREGGPVAALGMVAATGPAWRSMRGGEIDAWIELDLSLRRASEGGLALDAQGRAIGMTVFGPRRRVLVIPAATVERVAAQLEAHGRVPRGYLGLGLQPVRLDAGGTGAMVMSVDALGPGATAGLHQGDIVIAWNDQPLTGLRQLLRGLGPASVGDTARLTVRRGSETRTIDLVIGERPAA